MGMMDSLTTKHKIILATLIFLVILIPVVSFIISYRFRAQVNSQASTNKTSVQDLSIRPIVDNPTPQKTLLDELREDLEKGDKEKALEASASAETGGGTTLNLGPTLDFTLNIDGRPKTNQSEQKLFVGLAAGQSTTNPQYLLSFTVEVLPTGKAKEPLSISGLDIGGTYTAYFKGQTTLTAASTFTVKSTTSSLGTINLLVGDLNDDNVVNQKDKDLLLAAFGSIEGSSKWNPLADLNLDGRINTTDLAFLTKNMNKNGDSGPWFSTTPASATASGSLKPDTDASPSATPKGGPREIPNGQEGYWMWVPAN